MTRRIPLIFDGCSGGLFDASGGRGVVIVAPPGFEDLCSHRALDMLAGQLAENGLPTLRFDLPGTADSLGDAEDPDPVERWLAASSAAIDELRRLTGVCDVALVGLRLGAMLAADIAARRDDVARVALLASPASGKSYARELKVLSRVVAPVPAPPPELARPPRDGLELAGFHLPGTTVEAIQRLSWPLHSPASDTLIVAPAGGADLAGQEDLWASDGARISRQPFDGYERMMCDPTATMAPLATLSAIAAYLAEDAPARPPAARAAATGLLHGGDWIEEQLTFGADDALSGVFCRPAGADFAEAVVMVNAGGIRRIGWGRQNVEFARALAARGVASLRLDLSNIAGVSGPDPAVPFHYGDEIHAEISAAIDALEARGVTRFTLAGACSGAYHGLRAGVADGRVGRLVLVNQLCFEWGAQYAVPLNAWMNRKSADLQRKRTAVDDDLSDLARWRARMIENAMKIAKTSAKSAYKTLIALATVADRRDIGVPSAPERALMALSSRGVRVDFVHAEGDPGIAEFERWFGPGGARALALPGITQTLVPAADHLMTPPHARAMLLDILAPPREAERETRAPVRAAG